MRIKTFGYRSSISPLVELERELLLMDVDLVNKNPDIVWDMNGFYTEAIEYSKQYPNAIKIFNLLNADINNPNWGDGIDIKYQLSQAHVITTVSESTRNDIKKRTGFNSEVIYYPIKPIKEIEIDKLIPFLYVGRLCNKEKRFENVVQTMNLLGKPGGRLFIIGPEDPQIHPLIGQYLGNVSNNELNQAYNEAKYLLCPCEHEGSLCVFEAILANCIPIVSIDNEWSREFGLEFLSCDPDPQSIINKIKEIEGNYEYYREKINSLKLMIREKFDVKEVAKRIISIYNRIKSCENLKD